MLDIVITMFSYNRDDHVEQVLEGIRKENVNYKIYFFQDGAKNEKDKVAQFRIKSLVNSIDWTECVYIESEYNKGCAKSIEDGLTYVLSHHQATIIIEDDCVPLKGFFDYMTTCLEKYETDENVMGIGGFAWNLHNESDYGYDAYASGRTVSWGWATWSDRWKFYSRDCEVLRRIYHDKEASRILGVWGNDVEDMLIYNIRAYLDTWDVFWTLNMIERKKVFIVPFKSLVKNIGLDDSGTHCTSDIDLDTNYWNDVDGEFRLPSDTRLKDEIELLFIPVYEGMKHVIDNEKKDAIVWGIGRAYQRNSNKLEEQYNIRYFVDKRKIKYFEGIEIIRKEEIRNHSFDVILVAIQNNNEFEKVKNYMINDLNISEKMIIRVS